MEGVTRVAGLGGPGDAGGWRVFLSHTSELREFPRGASYVDAAERAVSAEGHVIVDMADFPAADQVPAQLCADRVRGCDVYVGILGTRYGSPVRDMPEVSYTELEFDTAAEAGLPRLVFVLDTEADNPGIPASRLIDREFGARQDAFRGRVRDSGLVTGSFASPAGLGQLVERSLRDLAGTRRGGGGGRHDGVPVVVGDVPQEPPGFQPRADLLAELDAPGPRGRVRVVHAVTGMRGVGKTQLAAAYARARIDDRWRLVAWVNAETTAAVVGGLAEVAAALGLDAVAGDSVAAGRAVRRRLEAGGDRCLLVFDNAADPADLLPFLPAAGAARVLVTSNERAVGELGVGVAVDVFTWEEALAFLAGRTGSPDAAGARLLAGELGRLPLALAQAAAVIAAQHLDYPAYLARLRAKPVDQLLLRTGTSEYPHGLAAAVLLALDAVRAGDGSGVCGTVMDLASVLSAAGVPRAVLHAAGQAGALSKENEAAGGVGPEVVDEAVGRLAGSSLLTFSTDGATVTAHRLVMRVIRERLARQGRLAAACQAAATVLQARAGSLQQAWQDRLARRDLVEQILAVHEHAAVFSGEDGSDLTLAVLGLRGWALWFLNEPRRQRRAGHRGRRAAAGRPGAGPGPGPPRHPDLPEQPRRRLPGGGPGRRGDRAARADPGRPGAGPGPGPPRHPAIPEQPRPRLLGCGPGRRGDRAARADPDRPRAGPGPGPPRHPGLPEQPRPRLRGRGPGRRGDPAARADPGRLRADPGPGPPQHPDLPEQPRRRLPGGGPGRRGDPAARANPGRPGAGPGPGPPRHPVLPEQPRRRLPGGGPGRRGDPAARADPGRPAAGPGPGPPGHPVLPEQPRRRQGGTGLMPGCSASEAKNAAHGARAPDARQVMRTAATG